MKKLFSLLMIGILTISLLTGCSQPNDVDDNDMDINETKELKETKEITKQSEETINPVATQNNQLGDFKAEDVNGNEVTKDIFSDYDLTLVNLFTTWCSPCVKEIPELDAVDKEMADKKVNVIGIVLDVNENGIIDKNKLDKLNKIIDSTKAEYTILLPDEILRNGRLKNVDSVPETFFVDKNGNIVGKTYLGSHTEKEWIKIIEDELSNLKK